MLYLQELSCIAQLAGRNPKGHSEPWRVLRTIHQGNITQLPYADANTNANQLVLTIL